MKGKLKCLVFLLFLTQVFSDAYAQDPLRLEAEVAEITSNDSTINKKDIVLFTGSSSIRMWTSIQSDFPAYNILNRGFGGSETLDLIYYFEKLILPYHPTKIFVYEGDNDLNSGKSPEQVISSVDSLIGMIRQRVSLEVPIYLISPKPSISRWHLREKYLECNKSLKALASARKQVYFIDVWNPVLDSKGNVLKDIFLEDGLHMNQKGYALWVNVIRKYLP